MAKPRWRIVPVDSLPFPERLWKCACRWRHEHTRIVAEIPESCPDRQRLAFERFVRELGPRLRECEYHKPDWHLIAAVAADAIETATAEPFGTASRLAVERGADPEWVESLFDHSIFVEGDGLRNGWHRVCAMKAAGVARCPVEL